MCIGTDQEWNVGHHFLLWSRPRWPNVPKKPAIRRFWILFRNGNQEALLIYGMKSLDLLISLPGNFSTLKRDSAFPATSIAVEDKCLWFGMVTRDWRSVVTSASARMLRVQY